MKGILTLAIFTFFCFLGIFSLDPSQAMIYAVRTQKPSLLKIILSAGFDVNKPNTVDNTVFTIAIKKGATPFVKLLIDHGANINLPSDTEEMTPLMHAANMGNNEIFQMLLDQGADLEAKDIFGTSVLRYASAGGSLPILEELLKKDPDLKSERFPILLYSVKNNHYEVSKRLIQAGADVNGNTRQGSTILMSAISKKEESLKLVKLLLDNGADVNATGLHGYSALEKAKSLEAKEIIELLETHQKMNPPPSSTEQ